MGYNKAPIIRGAILAADMPRRSYNGVKTQKNSFHSTLPVGVVNWPAPACSKGPYVGLSTPLGIEAQEDEIVRRGLADYARAKAWVEKFGGPVEIGVTACAAARILEQRGITLLEVFDRGQATKARDTALIIRKIKAPKAEFVPPVLRKGMKVTKKGLILQRK